MNCCRTILCIALIPCLLMVGNQSGSTDFSDEDAIRQLVSEYIVGWRDGDRERLAGVFANKGSVVWVSDQSGMEELDSMSFEDLLKRQKPRPEYGRSWKVLSLDIVDGQLAVAKVHISRAGGSYLDFLVCQKIANKWRIINKSFVMR